MTASKDKPGYRIGVISDTHGLLRPGVAEAFQGVDLILHAGDIDTIQVLKALKDIAPVKAVRGNMDRGGWADQLPATEVVEYGGVGFYMVHNIHEMDLDPSAAEFRVVISGHTHQPKIEEKNGMLFLNPGSAGPRRFHYPITAALLILEDSSLEPRIIEFAP